MIKSTSAAISMMLASALPVLAQDVVVYGGGEVELLFSPDGAGSDNTSSVSAYIEAEINGFYAGLNGTVENVDTADEVYAYLGYRRDLDSGFSYDLSYTQYSYPNDGGACCGEILVSLGQTLGDKASVSLDIYHVPEDSTSSAYIGLSYDFTDKWNGSVNYGAYEVAGAGNETEWDIGATYAINDEVGIDARYYDGTDYADGYFGLSVTYDTTLFGG
jgi:hypothetical protein